MARKRWQWVSALSATIIAKEHNADEKQVHLSIGETCKVIGSYADDLKRNGLVSFVNEPKESIPSKEPTPSKEPEPSTEPTPASGANDQAAGTDPAKASEG